MRQLAALLFLFASLYGHAGTGNEFTFTCPDELQIYGDHHVPEGETRAVIALFHQGGGNARAEYSNIIPRLLALGFEVYAFDMRAGGEYLGGVNRTIAAMGGDDEVEYCDVYDDVEAALEYLTDQAGTPVILWGSSYSGALVYQLASRNPQKVKAVLGFSPASGGPMAECRPGLYLDGISMPAVAFRPAREMGSPSALKQQSSFEEAGVPYHVIEDGVHGSSMLNPEKVEGDAAEAWAFVENFLTGLD